MRYVHNPDMLTPLMDTNTRTECICVDFNDFIRVESEGTFWLLSEMLKNDKLPENCDASLLTEIVTTYTRTQVFDLCAMYTPLHLVAYLLPSLAPHELYEFYTDHVRDVWCSPLAYHDTRYSMILNQLLRSNYADKVYIVKDKYYDESELKILDNIFGEFCNTKVIAYEGKWYDALKDHTDITFFMLRDGEELFKAITGVPSNVTLNSIEDKYFLLSFTSCNLIFSGERPEFRNQKIIDTYDKCHIYTTFLYPIEEEENGVG